MTAGAPCIETDVAVVGAGPAGCAFAINLAPFQRVLMVEKSAAPGLRIGESLPAAACRPLRDMGLWHAFLAQGHRPCQLSQSAWGSAHGQGAMRNLDGPGWHLDRARFDTLLQDTAQQRGATLLRQTALLALHRPAAGGAGWQLDLERNGKPLQVRARLLVDASGRSGFVARQLGSRRAIRDKLVCGWVYGRDAAEQRSGSSVLHAEAHGWWYSSPLPGQGRVLAFFTDADLPAAQSAHSRAGLLARLAGTPALQHQLDEEGFVAGEQYGFCAAHGASLDCPAGADWLAVGDAALAFDPLSSQGLFNGLYTGLAGAAVVQQYLAGRLAAFDGYRTELANIQRAYLANLDAWYGQETRWPDQPFWQRRQAAPAPASDSKAIA